MEGTVITKKGIQLLAKVLASKNPLNITRAAVGTGKIQKGYDPSSMIGLVEYKMDAMISGCSASGDIAEVTMQVSSEGIETGFIITEIGIFAEDPDDGEILYAYIDLSDDAQYIYPEGGEAIKFVEITLDIIIAEGTRVTAFINPSSMVRRQEFEETVKEINTHIKENQEEINNHVADKGNPHDVTKYQVGLGNVDDTADMDKPVSMDQQAAIDAVRKLLNDAISNHAEDSDNPHRVTREQVGLENVDNTSDANKPVSIAQQAAIDEAKGQTGENLDNHVKDVANPHRVTKAQVGLGNVDNTADANKPVSIAQQTALDGLYEQLTAYTRQKIADLINGAPSNLDTLKEVSDAIAAHKNIMDALDAAIGKKASAAEFDSHTKDATKHITAAERTGWNGKLAPTGDASNVIATFSQATARANLSSKEKLSVSLGKIMKWFADLANGAASTLLGVNLTASRALVADGNGKVAASSVTSTELGYLAGVKSKVQDQLNELNTGMRANLTLVNGFTGSAWYAKVGNLVLVSTDITCPGTGNIFANIPSDIIPIKSQHGPAWIYLDGSVGSIAVSTKMSQGSGFLYVRNWNGTTLPKDTDVYASFIYYLG